MWCYILDRHVRMCTDRYSGFQPGVVDLRSCNAPVKVGLHPPPGVQYANNTRTIRFPEPWTPQSNTRTSGLTLCLRRTSRTHSRPQNNVKLCDKGHVEVYYSYHNVLSERALGGRGGAAILPFYSETIRQQYAGRLAAHPSPIRQQED